jgi:hypothetical protein
VTFPELVKQLKKIPFDEIRKESEGYFEIVLSTKHLINLYPIFESYYGVPFKPSGVAPSDKAQNLTRNYGGIQKQQTLYYVNRNGVSDCAMIWPWNDGSRSTVKMAQGVIETEATSS